MYPFPFVVILLVGFVDMLGLGLVYPLFAAMIFDPTLEVVPMDSSPAWRGAVLGILIALTPLVQFFASPILGAISDLRGRRMALAVGIGTGCFGYMLAIVGVWTQSLWLLLAYRLCVGVSEGTLPVAQAALVDISSDEVKARRFSVFSAACGFGFTIGPYIGGKLSDPATASWASYTAPFIAAGAMTLLNLLLVGAKFPETRIVKGGEGAGLMQAFGNIPKVVLWKHLRWVFIGGFALSFGWSFFQEFIPVLLSDAFGFGAGGLGDYYACCGFWYAASSGFLTAPLIERFLPAQILPFALLASAVSMALFAALPDPFYVWLAIPPLMYAIALVYPTGTALISNCTSKESQGEVLGVYQSVQAAAMALSPLLVGSAVGALPVLAAWGGALSMALAAMAFWLVRRQAVLVQA